MATPAPDIYNRGVLDVPVVPNEFGQDGGKFYRCYDTLAEEVDDDMVDGIMEQLDGLLIFAGLFAGVNSAFLALTLPLMSPNPTDDTNALLRENNAMLLRLALGRNDSLPSAQALPSETFSPAGKVLVVNVLFTVSLTLALISSFMAVLGRQWLVYYRKRGGGGPDRQRWEQLKRFLGAERWGLEWALDDFLPSILQIGLVIFCISLTIYLDILHPTLSNVVGAFICVGLAILLLTAILAIWDNYCPFQSPLSHFISWLMDLAILLLQCLWVVARRLVGIIHGALTWIMLSLWYIILHHVTPPRRGGRLRRAVATRVPSNRTDLSTQISFASFLGVQVRREEESLEKLRIIAIRRAICTSDDALTLLHGVSNILAISDSRFLDILAADDEFTTRLSELWRSSYSRTLQLRGREQLVLATAIQCLYRAALAHVVLSSSEVSWERGYNLMLPSDKGSEEQRMLPPSDLVQNIHSNTINAYLSCVAFDWGFKYRQLPAVNSLPPLSSVDVLLSNSNWKHISIILKVIAEEPTENSGGDWSVRRFMGELHKAYVGDPLVALKDLAIAVAASTVRHRPRESLDILHQYLVPIFKFAGKAAVDSAESGGIGAYRVAKLLRLSETFVRVEDSPSNFVNIGRSLRRELISVLTTVRERGDLYYRHGPGQSTLDELIRLFTNLKARSMSPTISSNGDDLELMSLFCPILGQLQGMTQGPSGRILLERDISKENQLDRLFGDFKAAGESVSREIKRRDRDPELGIWCYWRDENS